MKGKVNSSRYEEKTSELCLHVLFLYIYVVAGQPEAKPTTLNDKEKRKNSSMGSDQFTV